MCDEEYDVKVAYSIFKVVFGDKMSEEQFERKHFHNPQKLENPIRIFYEDQKAAGINAFMGCTIINNGEYHKVAQSNDTAVLPEYRGKHIFTKIITAEEKSHNEEFIFGIPNGNSYPGFIKMGWTLKCEFTHYILVNNPIAILLGDNILTNAMRKIYLLMNKKNAVDENIYFRKSCVADFMKSELETINSSYECAIEKTNDYYNWKLSNRNDSPMFIKLYDGNTLLGYILYHVQKRGKGTSAVIDDFCVLTENEDTNVKVMKQLLYELAKEIDMIDNPLVNTQSADAKILHKAKMKDYRKFKRNYQCQPMIVSNAGNDAEYMTSFQMRNVDLDVFLNAQ